jgi:hypothetical protein
VPPRQRATIHPWHPTLAASASASSRARSHEGAPQVHGAPARGLLDPGPPERPRPALRRPLAAAGRGLTWPGPGPPPGSPGPRRWSLSAGAATSSSTSRDRRRGQLACCHAAACNCHRKGPPAPLSEARTAPGCTRRDSVGFHLNSGPEVGRLAQRRQADARSLAAASAAVPAPYVRPYCTAGTRDLAGTMNSLRALLGDAGPG